MRRSFFAERVWPVLFMVLVTAVLVSVLAVVRALTAETVRRNATLFWKRAVLEAAGVEVPERPEAVVEVFGRRVEERALGGGETVYVVAFPDGRRAKVVVAEAPGLWGPVRLAVGFEEGLERLTGIAVVDQNETPGLGGRITEAWFVGQFRGKRPPLRPVGEKEAAGESEFQAVTGATSSSSAVRKAIERAWETLRREGTG